jgi:hypothetical protein
MDSYVDLFQANGGSMVMLAKGNRSKQVVDACKKHRGFYLGSIGGPAAILAQNVIKKVEVLEYPELGMEAIWRIQVENFPAFIITDDKGNDFFSDLKIYPPPIRRSDAVCSGVDLRNEVTPAIRRMRVTCQKYPPVLQSGRIDNGIRGPSFAGRKSRLPRAPSSCRAHDATIS